MRIKRIKVRVKTSQEKLREDIQIVIYDILWNRCHRIFVPGLCDSAREFACGQTESYEFWKNTTLIVLIFGNHCLIFLLVVERHRCKLTSSDALSSRSTLVFAIFATSHFCRFNFRVFSFAKNTFRFYSSRSIVTISCYPLENREVPVK